MILRAETVVLYFETITWEQKLSTEFARKLAGRGEAIFGSVSVCRSADLQVGKSMKFKMPI